MTHQIGKIPYGETTKGLSPVSYRSQSFHIA